MQVVYYVAGVVVLYNPESHTQRHYRGHTEEVECLAVHPQVAGLGHSMQYLIVSL